MTYNPFDKAVGSALSADELQQLIKDSVAEGYYVEYKEVFPSNEKIGRSIASFANSYGGWYIVGVKTDSHNVASEICGFSLADFPDPISKVREITKSHIDPVPLVYPQVVHLDGGRAVLVTFIPDGQEAPFITKDGRIYRRLADSSDPVAETNRYAVDRLVDKGRSVSKRFKRFCRDERTFSKGESGQGWVNIFLSPYPFGIIERFDLLSSESLEQLLERTRTQINVPPFDADKLKINIPFNTGQLTHKSAILRNSDPQKLGSNSFTVELFVNGRAKFHIPLRYDLISLTPYGHYQDFASQVESQKVKELISGFEGTENYILRFVDIGNLWLVIAFLMTYYQEWLKDETLLTELQAAVTIRDAWRSVPFIDSDEWADYVQKFGLPVLHESDISIPATLERGMSLVLNDDTPPWLQLCTQVIGLAFGLPPELHDNILFSAIWKAYQSNVSKEEAD